MRQQYSAKAKSYSGESLYLKNSIHHRMTRAGCTAQIFQAMTKDPESHPFLHIDAQITNHKKLPLGHLSVSLEVKGIVPLPCLSSSSSCLVISMTLAQTTRLLASCSEAARFPVLVDRVDDPVDAGVAANGLVLRVDEDDLEVFVCRVLVNPVRVEHTQVSAATSDALLSG